MKNLDQQKKKLEQKKARIALDETRLKLKERKMRTRALIEQGGLITKAGLDYLPSNALYGALLSIKKDLDVNENLLSKWIVEGQAAFNAEKRKTTPVILKFDDQPTSDIREFIRSHGLRFNRFRKEWYGNIPNTRLEDLKNSLGKIKYNLEIIDDLN
jgi:hypothetical protein